MKIKGIPGIYFSLALIHEDNKMVLCGCYHPSKEQAATKHQESSIGWPVEIEDGIAYVPHESEMED